MTTECHGSVESNMQKSSYCSDNYDQPTKHYQSLSNNNSGSYKPKDPEPLSKPTPSKSSTSDHGYSYSYYNPSTNDRFYVSKDNRYGYYDTRYYDARNENDYSNSN